MYMEHDPWISVQRPFMGYVAQLMSTKGFLQPVTESKMCFSPVHKPSLVSRLSPPNGGKIEPGNIRGKHCLLLAPGSGITNQIAEWNHVYTWHFVHSAKSWQLKNEVQTTPQKFVKNSFQMCGRGASSTSPRFKFTVVRLWERLTHHTLQLQVYLQNMQITWFWQALLSITTFLLCVQCMGKLPDFGKFYWALLLSCFVFNEWGNNIHLNFFHTNFDLTKMQRHSSLYITNS